ncbi:WDGH domain-containing protein [Corynebacterium ulcerans]|uniref:WDGH domain-containing protein n=1 Tax=Corynebacterium ulcerans TaxID=65058 RepID=UPI0002DEEDDD|nr:hypothetical protein [Corynebacterium ulcerans]
MTNFDTAVRIIENAYSPAEAAQKLADRGLLVDDYHSIDELYDYRCAYNALIFNQRAKSGIYSVHKSIRHSDGELCFGGGWFIVSADIPGGQVTNHYPLSKWGMFNVPEFVKAAPWDGHTPQIALQRLEKLAR